MLLRLKEVPDRTAAEKLRGLPVELEQKPAAQTIFYEEILNKAVLDRGVNIGTVTDILQSPAHDILVIHAPAAGHKKEILVPYVAKFILKIADTIQADLSALSEA
jgi:ribosomal 30S subunit maturation factor RimM